MAEKKNIFDSWLTLADCNALLLNIYNPGTTEVKSQSLVSTQGHGATGSQALLMLHVAH